MNLLRSIFCKGPGRAGILIPVCPECSGAYYPQTNICMRLIFQVIKSCTMQSHFSPMLIFIQMSCRPPPSIPKGPSCDVTRVKLAPTSAVSITPPACFGFLASTPLLAALEALRCHSCSFVGPTRCTVRSALLCICGSAFYGSLGTELSPDYS